jgi:predicted negative regulator of RcsB-dependent stress response
LSWVAENGKDELRDLARLRLAALLLDEKAFDRSVEAARRERQSKF